MADLAILRGAFSIRPTTSLSVQLVKDPAVEINRQLKLKYWTYGEAVNVLRFSLAPCR